MWLESLLREGVYQVTFTKIDGSTRIMPCTLRAEFLPAMVVSENERPKPRALSFDTIAVYATDIQQWRSFKVMNVIEIKPV
jgi:hypothetical protein